MKLTLEIELTKKEAQALAVDFFICSNDGSLRVAGVSLRKTYDKLARQTRSLYKEWVTTERKQNDTAGSLG